MSERAGKLAEGISLALFPLPLPNNKPSRSASRRL